MRAQGATVGVGEVLAGHRALAAVPPADARAALRATLCSSRPDLRAFDVAWARLAGDGAAPGDGADRQDEALDALLKTAATALPRLGVPPAAAAPPPPPGAPDARPAAWSAEELLLHKDFATYSAAERALARSLLERLARRGAQRRSRRTRPAGRRGEVPDLRATVRASLRHDGEPVERRWRATAHRPRPLVLVVDVSGSMTPYARMLLQYVQATVGARRPVEAFALGTRLTRITRELRGRDPGPGPDPGGRRRSSTWAAGRGSATRSGCSTGSTGGGSAAGRWS